MPIDEKSHQLGDRKRRVGVVELDRRLLGQRADVAELQQMAAQQILQRGGGEEEFLAQAQFLAAGVVSEG